MNTRRSPKTTLCSVAAIVAASAVSALSFGDVSPSKPTETRPAANQAAPVNPNALAQPQVFVPRTGLDTSPIPSYVNTQPPPMSLRNVPNLGGSCQLGYRNDGSPPASRNAGSTAFNIVDDFRVLTTGQFTTISFSGQFRAGSQTNTSPYRDATPAELTSIGPNETFIVSIYADGGNGFPASSSTSANPPIFTQTVTTARVLNSPETLSYASGSTANPTATFNIYNYTCTVTGGPTLTAGTCYWLSIQHSSAIPAALVWRWCYSSASQGNGYSFQKTVATPKFDPFSALYGFDMAWCINLAVDQNIADRCPFIATPPSCSYPSSSTTPNTNCQASRLNSQGQLIVINSSNLISVVTADDFTTTAPNTVLSGMCFDGDYASGATEPPADEAYILRIWKNIPITGSSPYSFPDVSNEIAKVYLVPSYSTYTTNAKTAGTSIALPKSTPQYSFVGTYQWVVDLSGMAGGGINLPTAGCYWISIQSDSALDSFQYLLKQFSVPAGGTNGDNFFVAKGSWTTETTPFTVTDQSYGYDLSICLSFALNSNNSAVCPPVPAAANGTCATAVALPNPTPSPVLGQNLNAPSSLTSTNTAVSGIVAGDLWIPGDENSPGVWYTVTGNGRNITIDTCLPGTPTGGEPNSTNFNTTLYVYVASGSCTGFKFYADSDSEFSTCSLTDASGNSIGASGITFPTVSGQTYYVFVEGANTQAVAASGGTGFFWINVADGGAIAANDPALTYASIVDPPCHFTLPTSVTAPNILETEVCGTDPNTGLPIFPATGIALNDDPCNTSDVVQQLALGATVYGTQYNDGFGSNLDYYQLPDQTVDGVGYNISVFAETPIIVGLVQLPCPFPAAASQNPDSVQAVFVTPCVKGTAVTFYNFSSEADTGYTGSHHYVFVRPPSAGNVPCGGRQNYKLSVSLATMGACCTSDGGVCYVTTREDCTYHQHQYVSGTFGDGTYVGVYAGDNSSCTPSTICTAVGSEYLTAAAFGSCCDVDSTCYVTVQAACTGVGQHWVAASSQTSSINVCSVGTASPSGIDCFTTYGEEACCFSDGSCTFLDTAACTAQSGHSQAGFCLPLSCAPQVVTGTCCKGSTCVTGATAATCTGADTLFISGASSCNASGNRKTPCCEADFNHVGGITVQDIFDFLSAWFAKNPIANITSNGAGAPTVQSIFDFLSAWFAKGC